MVDYIDRHRDEFGVEPICAVLQIAPSTYYAAKSCPPSARAVRDVVMMQMLMVLWVANRKVYGAHKLWKAARRADDDIGRDQVARLMRELGIRGSRCPTLDRHRRRQLRQRPRRDDEWPVQGRMRLRARHCRLG